MTSSMQSRPQLILVLQLLKVYYRVEEDLNDNQAGEAELVPGSSYEESEDDQPNDT